MLIGISGKMGSGKNLVCIIIQGLTAAKKHNIENPSFEWIKKYYINSIWEQKAFAGKLKQTASLLTGIPVEKFEDQGFKNKELPEEWWYYKPGPTIYSYLEFKQYEDHEGIAIYSEDLIKTTPRLLLQIIGTECIRDKVHPNAWVNALFADYKAISVIRDSEGNKVFNEQGMHQFNYPNWIITDMRFPNELEAVKSRGGISIRVNRPYTTVAGDNGIPATFNHAQFHPSETALDSAEFDYVIENDSTIEDLIHTISLILKREKVI